MDYQEEPTNEVAEQVGVHGVIQQGNKIATETNQMQYQMEEAEQNLAETQLDVQPTLIKMYHLLRQDRHKSNLEKNGKPEWVEIKDEKKRILTDEGVDKIMQIVEFYINKETLLSNFDDKKINDRMLKFCYAFNGLLLMKYEIFFRSSTLEECEEILQERINEKVKKIILINNLRGLPSNEKEIRKEIVDEIIPTIDYEIDKIRRLKIKENLSEYEMLFTEIAALVEATHNRAWKGEERGSLRRHFNISEVIGGRPTQPQKRSGGWFGMGG